MEGVDWVSFDGAIASFDEFDSFYFGDWRSPFFFLIHPKYLTIIFELLVYKGFFPTFCRFSHDSWVIVMDIYLY